MSLATFFAKASKEALFCDHEQGQFPRSRMADREGFEPSNGC